MSRKLPAFVVVALGAAVVLGLSPHGRGQGQAPEAKDLLAKIGQQRGICVLLGEAGALSVPLARQSEWTFFVQSEHAEEVAAIRKQADAAGLLGTRIWVQQGKGTKLHLANDLADVVVAAKSADKAEVLRILRPYGKAYLGDVGRIANPSYLQVVEKPMAADTDEWRHPYHGPDNNPQSNNQLARRPFLTHYLAEPWYCPLTQITVISGGRMFKAFGDRSSAKPQEAMLNKLLGMNAFNGTILWQRDLSPGFMIHRNTMIATPDTLYVADDKSCKLIDAATGKVRDEIVIPEGVAEGPTWKWMALENGVLYALVGEKEDPEIPLRGDRIRGAGWPWWKYNNYKYGFAKTLLAINPASKKILWSHREQDMLDGRALCVKNGRIYFFSERKFLACLDAKSGKPVWRNADAALLEAIGGAGPAQNPMLGFASTAYMKCGDDALYFAGPQRSKLVAASTKDGKLLWEYKGGNVQLVLRKDGLYSLGEGRINGVASSMKLDPVSGKILATFPSRDRCTRATGCADSIFTRGGAGGSTAVFDVTSEQPKMGQLAPMRPACTDGVVVAHGLLFWGPWMCACDQTQIGVISLGPAGNFDYEPKASDADRLEVLAQGAKAPYQAPATEDWPTYRRDNGRSAVTGHTIPAAVSKRWEYVPPHQIIPTAPVAVGDLVFVSGADGIIRALDAATGQPRWSAYTGGPLKYPPAIWNDRVYAGAGDGWVYCFQAQSGRTLWRFRAAPTERIMPVHGTLTSTWPVGSGVLVDKGVVYAAAGIFNYDGTHVYALDALTGKIRWQNSGTGQLGQEGADGGVSVQGHLLLHGKSIYMPAGNRPTVASYALADGTFTPAGQGRGKHLYVHADQVKASGYPLYWRPQDDHFLTPLDVETPAGVIALLSGAGLQPRSGHLPAARLARLGPQGDIKKPLWSNDAFQEIAAVAVGTNALLVTGVNRDKNGDVTESSLCAVDLADGKTMWKQSLPAAPVAWGLALDREGRILVTLVDGRVLAFYKQ